MSIFSLDSYFIFSFERFDEITFNPCFLISSTSLDLGDISVLLVKSSSPISIIWFLSPWRILEFYCWNVRRESLGSFLTFFKFLVFRPFMAGFCIFYFFADFNLLSFDLDLPWFYDGPYFIFLNPFSKYVISLFLIFTLSFGLILFLCFDLCLFEVDLFFGMVA